MLIAVARHSAAAGQNTVVLLIKPQRIDNLIEFALKGLGFQPPQWSNQVKKKAFPKVLPISPRKWPRHRVAASTCSSWL